MIFFDTKFPAIFFYNKTMILSWKNLKAKKTNCESTLSNSRCVLHQSLIGRSKVGVANNSTFCFSGHALLLKPCRVFCCCLLLLFHHDVVVFVFCLYFQVRTGRQHQEERKFTLRFFSCFFLFCFISCFYVVCFFFSFDNFFSSQSLFFFRDKKTVWATR